MAAVQFIPLRARTTRPGADQPLTVVAHNFFHRRTDHIADSSGRKPEPLLPLILACLLIAGCATAPDRPAKASFDCMAAVRAAVPAEWPDPRKHCMASALIAQRCSVTEAYLAGLGKEFSDLFTGGDAAWADWRADRAGIICARSNENRLQMEACCADRGY